MPPQRQFARRTNRTGIGLGAVVLFKLHLTIRQATVLVDEDPLVDELLRHGLYGGVEPRLVEALPQL